MHIKVVEGEWYFSFNPSHTKATFVQSTRMIFLKTFKPCHVGFYWIAFARYSQMSTHMPGFQFVLAKLPTNSIRFKYDSKLAFVRNVSPKYMKTF